LSTVTAAEAGEFKRQASRFREWVTADGSSGLRAEPGRYLRRIIPAAGPRHEDFMAPHARG
jgi:glutathionyl-hydroquinone reductase